MYMYKCIYTDVFIQMYVCLFPDLFFRKGESIYIYIFIYNTCVYIQPIAFGVSVNLNLQSRSHWSLFNRTWQKRPRELDDRLRFEIEEMTLQMQQAVPLVWSLFPWCIWCATYLQPLLAVYIYIHIHIYVYIYTYIYIVLKYVRLFWRSLLQVTLALLGM